MAPLPPSPPTESVPRDANLMVLVEGEPGPARARARTKLEAALRRSGRVVLDARALGPARRSLRDEDFARALEAEVQWVLVASMTLDDASTPRFELRLVTTEDGRVHRRWCELDEASIDALSIEAELGTDRAPRRAERVDSPFVLATPNGWSPTQGRGPDRRPMLRERESGKWIDYAEAYARVGRLDWQVSYDRRMRGKLGVLVAGTLLSVGGITTSAVFATEAEGAYTRSRLATMGVGLASASVGGLLLVTSAMIDPHPVSIGELREQVEGRSSRGVDLQLHAGPSGASAGFRASF